MALRALAGLGARHFRMQRARIDCRRRSVPLCGFGQPASSAAADMTAIAASTGRFVGRAPTFAWTGAVTHGACSSHRRRWHPGNSLHRLTMVGRLTTGGVLCHSGARRDHRRGRAARGSPLAGTDVRLAERQSPRPARPSSRRHRRRGPARRPACHPCRRWGPSRRGNGFGSRRHCPRSRSVADDWHVGAGL